MINIVNAGEKDLSWQKENKCSLLTLISALIFFNNSKQLKLNEANAGRNIERKIFYII